MSAKTGIHLQWAIMLNWAQGIGNTRIHTMAITGSQNAGFGIVRSMPKQISEKSIMEKFSIIKLVRVCFKYNKQAKRS